MRRVNLRPENHRVVTEMPRITRRRNRRSLKKDRRRRPQRGGQLIDELATWRTDVTKDRDELLREVGGDPRNITFAKLAEKKFPIGNRVPINTPRYPNLNVGDVVSHVYYYLKSYFDNPSSYTMESVRGDLAMRKAEVEEDLGYTFLTNMEAALRGQNTVDILNIQMYPLYVFHLVINYEGGDPLSESEYSLKPILEDPKFVNFRQEELVVPGGQ